LNRAGVRVAEYEAGEYLFRKNDKSDRLCIILRGSADVSRVSEDGLMHMSTLKRNDLYGAASLFGGDVGYVTDIRCNERVRALVITEDKVLALLSENQTVLRNYLRYLNGRIRFLNKRLDAFSKNTVAAKLLTFFAAEAKDNVYTVKNYTKLSETLCLSRATLYRALDALETSGKIKREGKNITIMEEYSI
jgi:CRP-like cAMP-binding protein